MNNCTIIIFGVTGDLATRKLFPAIHALLRDKTIERCLLIGVAPEETTIQTILAHAQTVNKIPSDDAWQEMQKLSFYFRLDARNQTDFFALRSKIDELEQQYGFSGNRMLYCATPADYFCAITRHSVAAGIIVHTQAIDAPWQRIVYEKPFGFDYASAKEINNCIAQNLDEQQIFRIDHYLSEELMSSIATIRFANCIFEPLWNKTYVDQIQIFLDETIGIEGRGDYYDRYGALKDVMQNHVLELLSLVTMEAPKLLTGEYIRQERAQVLQKIEVQGGVLGQFEGYHSEKGVPPDSKTETFALLKLAINNDRWQGVPIFVRTGKCLQNKETAVRIVFKAVSCPLEVPCPKETNRLTIRIKPDPVVSLMLNVKKPGATQEAVPVTMEFCHNCVFKENTPAAYERLLEAVVKGEPALSVRFDEIEYAWQVIEQVKKRALNVYPYACGSMGPREAGIFAHTERIEW